MRILREHEPGDFPVVRTLRKTVARSGGSGTFTYSSGPRNCGACSPYGRGSGPCGTGSHTPGGAGCCAGDVPQMP